jgi:thiopeptide-type bacteriocin biosynthesis protein
VTLVLDEPVFQAADVALVRAAALPCEDPALPADPLELVRAVGADPVLREAVAVASPSLSAALSAVLAGSAPARAKDLRRLALGLAAYRLRISARTTPFGLFAGVAPAAFGPGRVRLGRAHRTHTRPDRGWLTALVAELEADPAVLAGLRVVANETATVRGGRVELPEVGPAGAAVSIRRTPEVAALLARAATPVRVAELTASAGGAGDLVGPLVRNGFLLTDLRPPADAADPIGHLLDRLGGSPLAAELRAVRDAVTGYDALPPGAGEAAYRALTTRMRRLAPGEHALHVDLALDADIRLPEPVAREVERAADTLWRLAADRPGTAPLREYHREFLERYGAGRAVPLAELLSEDTGLGSPYRPSPDRPSPLAGGPAAAQVLTGLVGAAAARGTREVELDDALLAALAPARSPGSPPPPSAELYAQLLAPSVDALADGDFRLLLGTYLGTSQAGAMLGRFAYLLPGGGTELAPLARAGGGEACGGAGGQPVRAAVVYAPRNPRSVNVAGAPPWLRYRIPVGVGADGPADLPPGELAVTATGSRLVLVSTRLGREVVPVSFTVLNPATAAPTLARFLIDLGSEGRCGLRGWNWGPLRSAPYLPRVRRGRAILAAASWAVDPELAHDGPGWAARLAAWRERCGVPERVLVAHADQALPLRLDDPVHQALFRRALAGAQRPRVSEVLDGDGWLTGPGGPHRAEVVVPLRCRTAPPPRPAPHRPEPVAVAAERVHLPGGEWLYAKVYTGPRGQDTVLRDHLGPLLASLGSEVDRWFFIRYADPRPHLRLRLHGGPAALWGPVLSTVHGWAAGLRRDGLIDRLGIDSYDPEIERYGGTAVLAAAERAFQADSAAVLRLLPLLSAVDPVLAGAVSVVDLLLALGGPEWTVGLLAAWPGPDELAAYASRRREALALVDPEWTQLRRRPYGDGLLAAWADRRAAVAEYGAALREAGAESLPGIAASLVHMHCNRLFGIDRVTEGEVLAVARHAVAARAQRFRAGAGAGAGARAGARG